MSVEPSRSLETEWRDIAVKFLHAQEQQKGAVSRFLHDEVGQTLSAAGLQLDALRMDLEDRVPDIGERTREIQELLERLVEQIRNLSYTLNPSIAERTGLKAALDRLVGRSRQEFPGTVRLFSDPSVRVAPEVVSSLYKIAELAVENAVRHSGGSVIELLLKNSQAGPELVIQDDGCGFDVPLESHKPSGLGLVLMTHYARQCGLEVSISSGSSGGTVVRVACENRLTGADSST